MVKKQAKQEQQNLLSLNKGDCVMTLYIIGNGFDLAHELPTRYEDFHQYLLRNYENIDESLLYVPCSITGPHGEEWQDESAVVSLLCYLINNTYDSNWSDLEKAIGEIDLISCFDDLPELLDEDGDRDFWHESYNNEDRATELQLAIPKISTFFAEWISSLPKVTTGLTEFSNMINPDNDLFLTFNYTETLETIYGCKNVVHIHGKIGEDLLFGHAGEYDYSVDNPHVPLGAAYKLAEIYDSLRKKVSDNIEKHHTFFDKLDNVNKIVSYGFSFSDIDLPYIEKICSTINTEKIVWYLNDFNHEANEHKLKIIESGFKGQFHKYSI